MEICSISGFLTGIAILILGSVLVFSFLALLAYLFNARIISRTGSTIVDNKTLPNLISATKILSSHSLDKIKSINFNAFKNLTSKTNSKLEKLNQLQELKNNKTITDEEFEALKKEILTQ